MVGGHVIGSVCPSPSCMKEEVIAPLIHALFTFWCVTGWNVKGVRMLLMSLQWSWGSVKTVRHESELGNNFFYCGAAVKPHQDLQAFPERSQDLSEEMDVGISQKTVVTLVLGLEQEPDHQETTSSGVSVSDAFLAWKENETSGKTHRAPIHELWSTAFPAHWSRFG